jgi:hypothetical protein
MKSNRKHWLFGLLCIAASVTAFAQGAGGSGPGSGTGGSGGMRMGPDNTMGWTLMTRQERIEHQNKINATKTYEECKAYVEQHHAQMTERAKEKGRAAPAQPRRDACASFKK